MSKSKKSFWPFFLILIFSIGLAAVPAARAENGQCLSLQQIHRELKALGANLEVSQALYDIDGNGFDKLSPSILAELLTTGYPSYSSEDLIRKPGRETATNFGLQGLIIYDPDGILSNSDSPSNNGSKCKPGDKIAGDYGDVWRVDSASKDKLKIEQVTKVAGTGESSSLEFHRLGNGRYEIYYTGNLKLAVGIQSQCYHGLGGDIQIPNFTQTAVIEFGEKDSLPQELPISSHMAALFVLAAKPDPVCLGYQMQNTNLVKPDVAAEESSGGASYAAPSTSAGTAY